MPKELFNQTLITSPTEPDDSDRIALGQPSVAGGKNILWSRFKEIIAGITSFLNLTDTPSDYTGQAGKAVRVNSTEDGLEFSVNDESETINKNDRKLSRAFANGFFHEFGFNAYEDSGTLYIEVFNPLQEWLIGTSYTMYNAIFYNGYKYTAYKDSTGVQPDTDYTLDPTNPSDNTWFRDEEWDGKLRGNIDGTVRTFELDVDGTAPNGGISQALVAGTSTSTLMNYIYAEPIGNTNTLQLVASTTLPVGGVIFVGYVGCFDVTSHQGGRPFLPMQRFTNAFYKDSIEKSLIGAMREKLRYGGITYETGVSSELVITTNAGAKDNLNVNNTAGYVAQLWPQDIAANLNANGYVVLNAYNSADPTNPLIEFIDDLNEIIVDANGDSLTGNGTRFGLELVGICASGDNTVDMLGVLLPNGSYGNDADAINDVSNYTVTTVPDDFYVTSFRTCRIVLKYATTNSGTYTNLLGTTLVQDRRRWPVGSFGGGAGSSGGGGIDTFLELLDVGMTSYTGLAGQSVVVNDAGNGLTNELKTLWKNVARTFSLTHVLTSLTQNINITWQNKSITVAGLDDIPDQYEDGGIALSDGSSEITTDADDEILIRRNQTITKLTAAVTTAPTGSSIIVQQYKNGVLNATVTIAAGSRIGTTTTFVSSSFAVDDWVKHDTTQVGTTFAGVGLKAYLETTLV